MTSLGAQGIFDYERPRHLFCMLIELPILFVLFVWNFVDTIAQDYLASRNGLVWREMIFDFIVVVAIGFFLFNYMRRGGGYAGSYFSNATGVATTALIEFVAQIVVMLHYIREAIPQFFRFGPPPSYQFWRPFFFVFFSIVLVFVSLYVAIMVFRALHSALARATYIEGPPLGMLPSNEAAIAASGYQPPMTLDPPQEQL